MNYYSKLGKTKSAVVNMIEVSHIMSQPHLRKIATEIAADVAKMVYEKYGENWTGEDFVFSVGEVICNRLGIR